MLIHKAEENYLKAIYSLTRSEQSDANTNLIAEHLNTKASSVTDMAKRLAEKGLINYTPYKGLSLTEQGEKIALQTIRKHRLWECFLVEKLGFKWDEVHDIAEQLEHINSEKLTNKLDEFLKFPKFDPHGDPIPDSMGIITKMETSVVSDLNIGDLVQIVGVKDSSSPFLQYLDNQQMLLGTQLLVKEKFPFDHSLQLVLNNKREITISQLVSKNIIVKHIK